MWEKDGKDCENNIKLIKYKRIINVTLSGQSCNIHTKFSGRNDKEDITMLVSFSEDYMLHNFLRRCYSFKVVPL